MLEFLFGKVIDLSPTDVVVQVGGMAYKLNISIYTHDEIKGKEEIKLFTHVYVKNEGQNLSGFVLYGFATQEERLYFSTIIGVSGIGASTARLMLSAMQPKEIARAITLEDVPKITTIKGIGPKTAKRLILELKDKIPQTENGIQIDNEKVNQGYNTIATEALSALVLLGFSKASAQKTINSVTKTETIDSVEQLLKLCLKKL